MSPELPLPNGGETTPSYRPWIVEPGTLLSDPHDPFERLRCAEQFHELTGIPIEYEPENLDDLDIAFTSVCPVPFPIIWYNPDTDLLNRPQDVSPEVLWNPLFWLPEALTHPYPYKSEDGSPAFETVEEWQYRVILELTASGLYVPETGLWRDVLQDFAGLNVDAEETKERLRAWRDGGDDAVLDSLRDQVGELIAETGKQRGDELWAVRESSEAGPIIAEVNQYLYARHLNVYLADDPEANEQVSDEYRARTIAAVASFALSDLPEQIPLVDGSTEEVGAYIKRIYDQAQLDTIDAQAILEALRGVCTLIDRAVEQKFSGDSE